MQPELLYYLNKLIILAVWIKIYGIKFKMKIKLRVEAEPSLGSFLYSLVLSQKDLIGAVASILSFKIT